MKRSAITTIGAGAALAFLAACSGGAPSQAPLPSNPVAEAGTSTAQVLITLGRASSGSTGTKAPAYVSPGALGAAVLVFPNGGTPPTTPSAVADLSPGSTNCTANANGTRSCNIAVTSPNGSDNFQLTLYDHAPVGGAPTGNALATGGAIQTINIATTNSVPITLNGVPASVVLTLNPTYFTRGATQSSQMSVVVKDASGNIITSPGSYSVPITLTNSDTSGSTTLSQSTILAPSTATVTVSYNGGTPSGASAAFGATGSGITGVTNAQLAFISPSPIIPSPTNVAFLGVGPTNTRTITVSEANYTGNFTAATTSCNGIVSLTSSTTALSSFTFQSIGVGSCAYTIGDGTNVQTVPFSVQTAGFSLSPTQLTFLGTGTTNNQTVTLNEPNYSGTFTYDSVVSTCTNSAAGTGKASVSITGSTATISPTTVGACTVTLQDNSHPQQSAILNVSITTESLGGQ